MLTYANVKINSFKDYYEIIHYSEPFPVNIGDSNRVENVDRARKFLQEGEILHPLYDSVRIADLQRSIKNSCDRAKDNFYGYALCNDWQYFITLTFNPKYNDVTNEDYLRNSWSLFRKKLQYLNRNVKILCVPERHTESKVLHFHALVGNINLENYLKPSINWKTGKQRVSRYRQPIFNLLLWDEIKQGYSTVVHVVNMTGFRLANYLISYTTKQNNIGYNKKKYYRTNNLNFKDMTLHSMSKKDLDKLLVESSLFNLPRKENDKMTVYVINRSHATIDYFTQLKTNIKSELNYHEN